MFFIIINGAAGSGKDTLGSFLRERLKRAGYNVIWGRIKDVIYKATAIRYELPDLENWIKICNDPILKDTPMQMLGGKTPRQVLIYESENVIKVIKGETGVVEECVAELYKEYGEYLLRRSIIVFTDGGFQSETDWLIQSGLTFSTPIIIRLGRKGHNFDGDSRQYLSAPNYIFNNRYAVHFLDLIASIIVDDIRRKDGTMGKEFIKPPVTCKQRIRATVATALMLKEGSIKVYEVGMAYRCNLRAETRRKW